jgi:hypothetical protein
MASMCEKFCPDHWPRYAESLVPHLVIMAAGSGGRYLPDDIAAEIRSGRWQAWLAMQSPERIVCVMVSQIIEYPRVKALRLIGISGRLPAEWHAHLASIAAVARNEMGCTRMEAMHPPHHYRVLRHLGWSPFHILMECAL